MGVDVPGRRMRRFIPGEGVSIARGSNGMRIDALMVA
jgi:hypothetical protein